MHVDVDRLGRQLDEEEQRGDVVALPRLARGAVEGGEDGAVAQQPAVDEDEDAPPARGLGIADQAPGAARRSPSDARAEILQPRREARPVEPRDARAQPFALGRAGLGAQQRAIVVA